MIVMALGQVVAADEDEEREKPAEETCDFCPSSQLGIFSEASAYKEIKKQVPWRFHKTVVNGRFKWHDVMHKLAL